MRFTKRQSCGLRCGNDPVETVRRINRRWIVHGGLRDTAAAYLEELREKDPARLRRSCELAMDLVHGESGGLDPKPWFYAGLFSLATADEARRMLASHPLTLMVWRHLRRVPDVDDAPDGIRELGGNIADSIRRNNPMFA